MRDAALALVKRIGFGESPVRRSWMPQVSIDVIPTPPTAKRIHIPGTSRGLLYVMRSPHFDPAIIEPLQVAVIGPGDVPLPETHDYHDMIAASHAGFETGLAALLLVPFAAEMDAPMAGAASSARET